MATSKRVHALFIGGGPAGLAPLVWAARTGTLVSLAAGGLIVAERGARTGAGELGEYAITSDTLAETFLECCKDSREARLTALLGHPAARALAAYRGGSVPLPVAAAFMAELGDAVSTPIRAVGGEVRTGTEALYSQRQPDGMWMTRLRTASGEEDVAARHLVLATGGSQRLDLLERVEVAGQTLLPRYADKLVESGDVLAVTGPEEISRLLSGIHAPRVAIVGGSHSALCAARVLLEDCPELRFGAGAVTVLHNRPLRVFYRSAAEAEAEGYTGFAPDDVCPVTNYLFRFAGFRLETRELVLRAMGIGGRPHEPRLHLHRLAERDEQAWRILDEVDLVIAALGYRPRALPLFDAAGNRIALAAETDAGAPLIDRRCRVLDAAGAPIPGVLGIGLGAGFVPDREFGGEASFDGQTNGIWLWQNGAGPIILDALLNQGAMENAAVIAA